MQVDSGHGEEEAEKKGSTLKLPYKQTCIVMTILSLSFLSEASTFPRIKTYTSTLVAGAVFILMICLTEYKGRKLLFISLYILSVISSTAYLMEEIIIGETGQVAIRAATMALTGTVLCEYCEPRHRIIHLITNSAILRVSYWVIFMNASNGGYGNYMEYFKILLGLVGLVSVLTWPESPYWLASKRRFEESRAAFSCLRRKDSPSTGELQALTDQSRPVCPKMIYAPLILGLPVVLAISLNLYTLEYYFYQDVTKHNPDQTWLYLLLNVVITVGYIILGVKVPRRRLILLPTVISVICVIFIMMWNYVLDHLVSYEVGRIISKVTFSFLHMVITCAVASINYPIAIEMIPSKYSSVLSAVMGLSFIIGVLCYNVFDDLVMSTIIFCVIANPIAAYFLLPEAKDMSMIEIERAYQPKQKHERANV